MLTGPIEVTDADGPGQRDGASPAVSLSRARLNQVILTDVAWGGLRRLEEDE